MKVFSDGMARGAGRAARQRVLAAPGGGDSGSGDSDFPCVSSVRSPVR